MSEAVFELERAFADVAAAEELSRLRRCIGDLAVNGTINDVSMTGARPFALSVGVVLEEGMPIDELGVIAQTMGAAARRAGP